MAIQIEKIQEPDGCTQARISDMEAGVKPISAEAAQLFAKRFGVSPALFLK